MELFILAAVSLTIAVSLLLKKEKDAVQLSFALVCLALFLHKGGTFFNGLFEDPLWRVMSLAGFLALPPLLLEFSRSMLRGKSFLSRKEVAAASVASLLWAAAFFTPLVRVPWFEDALPAYLILVILYCFGALLLFIRGRGPGVERTRMVYVTMACAITAAVSLLDIFYYAGFPFPPVSNLALAGLLYFVLIIILHPRLPELYEIMVRGLVVSVVTLFATSVFFFILGLFGTITPVYFTHVLTASFIIVISYDPFRVIMKKVFNYFFPEAKDIFSSIYGFDQELEKEKSQLLDEMATALAHEIRNPLGSIKGAGQYLRSETDNAENQKLLDVIIEVDRPPEQRGHPVHELREALRREPEDVQRQWDHRKGRCGHPGQRPAGRGPHRDGAQPGAARGLRRRRADEADHPQHRLQRHRGHARRRHSHHPHDPDRERRG